jgi:hypothetical protein
MTTIIAGGFQVHDAAEAAIGRLLEAGIPDDNLCSFRVNPPGEHSQLAIGGDRHESPGRWTSARIARRCVPRRPWWR